VVAEGPEVIVAPEGTEQILAQVVVDQVEEEEEVLGGPP
jgi:hypothetical protein